ncbi:cysteine desulfurase [Haematospirillum jordaniae]|uniref:Cysteine desulfurase n=1 Tax=Haematospirillum jordaniae TaxID=1549855 RepID=A0A143DEQ2_9PROT|nr:cysteine desulfurase [Haematospirillum jordaniae]AMW35059.1 cysteine desulfurase [Haematospirillum jordaniae]NKD56573.1 cysteine desulfurase [Haematospirillum jordaniae]NKD58631.1 cysteine desulfurase [Haematospirillum jordaniae]NKD66200.1 cysteine desulfurase [Haematospirillum jordaniae]NKD78633.1 cysteine desulfurase [Haematospirillum jordaniae]
MTVAVTSTSAIVRPFDVEAIRADFPILSRTVHGKPLAYLDTGASAQKPAVVLDVMRRAYEEEYANVHRGAYWLSERSTLAYEAARRKVQEFLNAASEREIILTRGATEAINLVANSYGRAFLKPGDEIVLTELEHHSNIVPWQMLRDQLGLVLKVAPVCDDGSLDLDAFSDLLTPRTRLVAIAHVSNVLGTVLPVRDICSRAHAVGAVVLVDGCQGVVHQGVDVQELGCDFYVFSAHKLYGPTGVGVLWGRETLLDRMPPWMGGGDMISSVTFEKSEWASLPAKFEAGTPPIVQAIGLGAAIDYVAGIDRGAVLDHETDLLSFTMEALSDLGGLTVHGTTAGKAGLVAFSTTWAHPHDLATVLDRQGVCVRAGHHCAQPLMARLGVSSTTRASFGLYTNRADIDAFIKALCLARDLFE